MFKQRNWIQIILIHIKAVIIKLNKSVIQLFNRIVIQLANKKLIQLSDKKVLEVTKVIEIYKLYLQYPIIIA